tara:strand:- start:450 stop:995 length:546 start_codon:yes stop_codon:yes gene_type:complete
MTSYRKVQRAKALHLEEMIDDQKYLSDNDEDFVVSDLEGMSNREIYDLMKGIERLSSNLRDIKKILSDRLQGNVYKSAQRFNDDIVIGRPKYKWKAYDKSKVLDYLGDDWQKVVRPEFRITGIQAIARQRGQDPWVIMESLFEQVEVPGVNIVPINRAPKYLQGLDEAELIQIDKGDDTDE